MVVIVRKIQQLKVRAISLKHLDNFILIHLIHSSGPEPGGQYAVTTCPIRGTKRRSPQGLKQRC